MQGSTLLLKPVTVIDRAEADRQLDAILSRVKYVGPEPEPSEDEVMDTTLLHEYANPLKKLDISESVNLHKCLILLDSCQIPATR